MSRILFVNDDEDLVHVCKLILESYGHRVVAVTGAAAALKAVRPLRPELIIVDNQLGDGMTGVELTRYLRHIGVDVPMVMISSDQDVEMRARGAGIDRFVAKPFMSTELVAAIDRLLPGDGRPTRSGA